MERASDIRHRIFQGHMGRNVTAVLIAEASGILSGIRAASALMTTLGLNLVSHLSDGGNVDVGQKVLEVAGNPLQIAEAEEQIIGALSKSSGIATAAHQARHQAGSSLQVVSGGWKKMPVEIKNLVRQAVRDGGIEARISEGLFVYLDKNYVRILGGIREAVEIGLSLTREVVVQIRGETASVEDEAVAAAEAGASVLMVDTGRHEHLDGVIEALKGKGLRAGVRIAFAGEILLDQIKTLVQMDLDIVDIGYAILDAPCLPMRFDVISSK